MAPILQTKHGRRGTREGSVDEGAESLLGNSGRLQEGEQSSELGDNMAHCEHFIGGSETDDYACRLRHISRKHPEAYKELEILRNQVVGRYVREIYRQSFGSTRKYLSDVIIFRDAEHRNKCLDRINSAACGYPGKILLWTDEGDHLHIVHDCPFSNGQCRCYFKRGEEFRRDVRAPIRRPRYISEMDELDWSNVFLYFILSKRESNSQVWIGGRLQRSPDRDEIIRWRDLQNKSREILDGEDTGVRHHGGQEERHSEDGGESLHSEPQETRKKRSRTEIAGASTSRGSAVPAGKQTKFQRISKTVHALLNEYFILPAINMRDVLVYDDCTTILFDPSNEKCYQAACDVFNKKFIGLKLKDLCEIYTNALPVFYANNKDPFTYYHSMEDSLKYITDLLNFQFDNNEEHIAEFLTNIRDWFDLKGWECNNKINAICIIGTHNAGKNYFFDMLAAIAYNVGHIGRVNNKTNQFALQECYGRRFIMGNELNMEDGAKEDFKKICEGTACNIRVKYQADKIFTRAPVCLISNKTPDICHDIHFKDVRLVTLRWRQCELLKDSNKKPYPLCLFRLFEIYNVAINAIQ